MTVTTKESDARELLRSAGLRVTGPRLAILDALAVRPHSDADAVIQAVRSDYGTVSTQAVYDALRSMSDRGLLRRIEPAGQAALYERRVGDNHHHLICRGCAMVVDVPCVAGTAPCLTPSHESEASAGFAIDEAEVTFWGYCATCQKAGLPGQSPRSEALNEQPETSSDSGLERGPDDAPTSVTVSQGSNPATPHTCKDAKR